ncbi:DUF2147 domain-containing protein [Novosphingobium sp. BL-8A]|uniref:DUF2147 domain-containing protein n=1 Tax=Novosphingobium sp. BL-8A TaxID=3127639 RepID=UPI003757387C
MNGIFMGTGITLACVAATLALLPSAQAQPVRQAAPNAKPNATDVQGRWLTDDKAGVVEIAPCGNALCGTLAAVLNPKAPAQDVNNPDPARRGRALVGIAILTGLMREANGWGGGEAYDPKTGHTYRASIRLGQGGRLDVTGCVLLICRTRHWTRSMEENSR